MSLPGAELAAFPDAEAVMIALIGDLVETGTRTPEDLGADGPSARAIRTGGGDDGITDRPIIAVTAFAPTRAESWALSRRIQQRVLAAGGTAVVVDQTPVLIDRANTYTGPLEHPDQNPNLRAVPTYFVLEFRRPRRQEGPSSA